MATLLDVQTKTTVTPSTPDPAMAMLFFFIATSLYCAFSMFITDKMQRTIFKTVYILFVVTGEYFINLSLSESMCGIRQWGPTLTITIIPWLLIFGVLQVFLVIFPGWLSPFSNTIGYGVVRLMGLPEFLLKDVLRTEPIQPNGEAARALESVKLDQSLLINELYTEGAVSTKIIDDTGKETVREVRPNFDKAWDSLKRGGIVKPDFASGEYEFKAKSKLYAFVQMKYSISEYVWNMLTGLLVTSVSYNYIINTGCLTSPKVMKERYDAYEEKAQAEEKKKTTQKANAVVYKQVNK